MRQAINSLPRNTTTSEHDLLPLRIAAVDLASLMVRLAANTAAGGRARQGQEERSAALDATLSAVTTELTRAPSRSSPRP